MIHFDCSYEFSVEAHCEAVLKFSLSFSLKTSGWVCFTVFCQFLLLLFRLRRPVSLHYKAVWCDGPIWEGCGTWNYGEHTQPWNGQKWSIWTVWLDLGDWRWAWRHYRGTRFSFLSFFIKIIFSVGVCTCQWRYCMFLKMFLLLWPEETFKCSSSKWSSLTSFLKKSDLKVAFAYLNSFKP